MRGGEKEWEWEVGMVSLVIISVFEHMGWNKEVLKGNEVKRMMK